MYYTIYDYSYINEHINYEWMSDAHFDNIRNMQRALFNSNYYFEAYDMILSTM